ncbi:glutaredoxin domain-containing protein [Rutstroemia sp. NJR-2017a BBW]|nr:glutaredoxin domain-containing protein [Rutstroemia sp. NJR-2017a BBW]
MHPTIRLFQACRITLFTRANCSLCTTAKDTLFKVRETRPFVYKEINVMEEGQTHWKDLYEFDTPVIHVSSEGVGEERSELAAEAKKLMHRFTEEEVKRKMNEVEGSAAA